MSDLNRRDLLTAAGAVAAAGLTDFASIAPQVVRAGGTVTVATGEDFPVLVGNDAASFLLVLKPGAVREPH